MQGSFLAALATCANSFRLVAPGLREFWILFFGESPAKNSSEPGFAAHYETVAKERATRYFNVFKDFFAGYAEFSQVYFFISKGMSIPEGHQTTSVDFDAVEMFYGNTYENFSELVDYLAMWNNMLLGRPYDTFERMDLADIPPMTWSDDIPCKCE